MIAVCFTENKEEVRKLWREAQELTMIFQKIVNSAQKED